MHPLINDLIDTTYGFHFIIVGAVISFALLVYLFSFKSAVEPPFDKLSYPGSDERRQGAGKKKKPKDKKAQSNGHATAVGSDNKKSEQKSAAKKEDKEKSPLKEGGKNVKEERKSPAKNALRETKGSNKDTKKGANNDSAKAKQQGKGKENVELLKNKKNQIEEKPKDFDDGEWEQALSRKDKKNRKATLDDVLSKDKKKDGKKKNKRNDESGDGDKNTEEPIEKSQVLEALAEIGLSTSEVETPAESSKPKKTKKSKKVIEQAAAVVTSPAEISEEKQKEPFEEPVVPEPPAAEAKPQRQSKKQETTIAVNKTDEIELADPTVVPVGNASEGSNVVFDELGDAWKEAKAPKKSTKKKSRKD